VGAFGASSVTSIGQVSVDAGAVVSPTGVSAAGQMGQVIVWGAIIPTPGTAWTDVDPSDTTIWTDVSPTPGSIWTDIAA
jgi:hypothetical protein